MNVEGFTPASFFLMHATFAWQRYAACVQPAPNPKVIKQTANQYFPENAGIGVGMSKRTCMRCPVRDECLQYALDNGIEEGIWGGLTERERHELGAQR